MSRVVCCRVVVVWGFEVITVSGLFLQETVVPFNQRDCREMAPVNIFAEQSRACIEEVSWANTNTLP